MKQEILPQSPTEETQSITMQKSSIMNEKFKNVPLESDTKILKQKECNIGGYDTLYQKWKWESTIAESIIFAKDDVAHLNDDEVQQLVVNSELANSQSSAMTISRGKSDFVFVNFGFKIT